MSTAIQRQRRTASGMVTAWCVSEPSEKAPNGLRCSLKRASRGLLDVSAVSNDAAPDRRGDGHRAVLGREFLDGVGDVAVDGVGGDAKDDARPRRWSCLPTPRTGIRARGRTAGPAWRRRRSIAGSATARSSISAAPSSAPAGRSCRPRPPRTAANRRWRPTLQPQRIDFAHGRARRAGAPLRR